MPKRWPRPLSVAMDASLWDDPTTGIGLYTRHLVRALGDLGVQVRCLGARISGESPRGAMKSTTYFLTRLPAVLKSAPEPIFHGVCNFTLPLARIPGKRMVLTVHDVIPSLFPNAVSLPFRWQFRLWLTRSLQVADLVICDSKRTRADLLNQFSVAPAKVQVVYLGVDHGAQEIRPHSGSLGRWPELPPEYVLYAGALDARKNIGCLLDAIAALQARARRVPLVLMGQPWFGSNPIERRIEEMRKRGFEIQHLGYQPAGIFYEVMRRATVFVFPSRYEGFGLPPLEAMYLGVATIISSAGALPEVCGEAALQINPEDSVDLAASIEKLLASPQERLARASAGREWASRFTWEATAKRTAEVYRSLLE